MLKAVILIGGPQKGKTYLCVRSKFPFAPVVGGNVTWTWNQFTMTWRWEPEWQVTTQYEYSSVVLRDSLGNPNENDALGKHTSLELCHKSTFSCIVQYTAINLRREYAVLLVTMATVFHVRNEDLNTDKFVKNNIWNKRECLWILRTVPTINWKKKSTLRNTLHRFILQYSWWN